MKGQVKVQERSTWQECPYEFDRHIENPAIWLAAPRAFPRRQAWSAKESRGCLIKIRLSGLQYADRVAQLEQEADELSAIFASILINTIKRLEREGKMRGRRSLN